MRHLLRRHPFAMRTHFAHSLVLTYALPPRLLTPLVPPGLALDTHTDPDGTEHGFVVAAVVDSSRRTARPSRWSPVRPSTTRSATPWTTTTPTPG
ncbi:hypothetical protein ACIQOW_13860 [Kitasatospora sp. NPDC091335]|uniref:hypothetical protein n=1 Tax=Kitasatospora sp. NPDC091335 TaxID=3364085 RepID=UPI00380A7B38